MEWIRCHIISYVMFVQKCIEYILMKKKVLATEKVFIFNRFCIKDSVEPIFVVIVVIKFNLAYRVELTRHFIG